MTELMTRPVSVRVGPGESRWRAVTHSGAQWEFVDGPYGSTAQRVAGPEVRVPERPMRLVEARLPRVGEPLVLAVEVDGAVMVVRTSYVEVLAGVWPRCLSGRYRAGV